MGIKEETKKLRKLEGDLRGVFTEINVEETSSWTEVMAKIQDKEAFTAITEAQAEKMFKDYQKDLGETCLHNHGKRKSKKSKKKKKASSSESESEGEAEKRKGRKRSKKESESSESDSDSDYHKKKKKKKKKARAKSVSESRSPVSSEAEDSHRRKR